MKYRIVLIVPFEYISNRVLALLRVALVPGPQSRIFLHHTDKISAGVRGRMDMQQRLELHSKINPAII